MAPDGESAAFTALDAALRSSTRRLRLAGVLAPTSLLLVVGGPAIAALLPISRPAAQALFALVGGAAACTAVYHADACDDLPSIGEQNLRLLTLLMSMVAIAIAGAWMWLGLMNLTSWILGSGAQSAL